MQSPQTGSRRLHVPATTSRPSPATSATVVTGLPAGTWSGHRPGSTIAEWSYSGRHPDRPQFVGSVDVAGLSHPHYPYQLPVALRFRFAGAPLWWSAATDVPGAERASSTAPAALATGLR